MSCILLDSFVKVHMCINNIFDTFTSFKQDTANLIELFCKFRTNNYDFVYYYLVSSLACCLFLFILQLLFITISTANNLILLHTLIVINQYFYKILK